MGLYEFVVSGPKRAESDAPEPLEKTDDTWYYASVDDLREVRRRLPTIGAGVSVRASRLRDAGNGLFADCAFAVGALVTEYDGTRISFAEARTATRDERSHYRSLQSRISVIAGLREPEAGRGGGSFVNDARTPARTNAQFVTLRLLTTEPVFTRVPDDQIAVALVATRTIADDEEVYASYGTGYWEEYVVNRQF